MTDFQVIKPEAAQTGTENYEDKRSLTEKCFYDHDPATGNLVALSVVELTGGDDWKRYTDCIPLMRNFAANDPEYTGPLKGQDVLIFGGRRKGRAGTGIELAIPVAEVKKFCELAQEVATEVQQGE